jgi:hypothetical protein
VCVDADVLAFDSASRAVGGELGTVPVAEWFGRAEIAAVSGTPRLTRTTAGGTLPVVLCSVFDPTAGFTCPDEVAVDLTWTVIVQHPAP